MENVTITVFVKHNCLISFLSILKVLDCLDIENEYIIDIHELEWSETIENDFIHINLPIDVYLKFTTCYRKSLPKN